MRHFWTEEELTEHFTLTHEEHELLKGKHEETKLGFAVLLKFFQYEGRFPTKHQEVPKAVIAHIASQINVDASALSNYRWQGRSIKRHRSKIRELLGFKKWSNQYSAALSEWLVNDSLPDYFQLDQLKEKAINHLRGLKVSPPTPIILDRLLNSAFSQWESIFFHSVTAGLPEKSKIEMDSLLQRIDSQGDPEGGEEGEEKTTFREIKADAGNVSLQSIIDESTRLECIRQVEIPPQLFKDIPSKLLIRYRDRAITEPARKVRRHPPHIRYSLLAVFLHSRKYEITDNLTDLLIQTVHRIKARTEKKITTELVKEIKKVRGKDEILFKMATAACTQPDATVKDAIFPAVGERTLQNIVQEYKYSGSAYKLRVNSRMRLSYRSYYRRMLPNFIDVLEFRSNNQVHQPIIAAANTLKKYSKSQLQYYPVEEDIPTDGIVPATWRELVFETNSKGHQKINRIAYELCVFRALREKLRCKEIWVVGADRYRNPDEDVPQDFEEKRTVYYKKLGQPENEQTFALKVQNKMADSLGMLDKGLPGNSEVEILKKNNGWIKLTQYEAQAEPKNLLRLKSAISNRWNIVNLLDVLKETDLRVHFTRHFKSVAQRETLTREVLQKRLLLCLYALGTNTGIKRISSGDHGEKYADLMYVQRRFITKEYLRQAIAGVVNEVLATRLPHFWGEATTACASDSKHFAAWDQNLISEWHNRYRGRGVMIYWHVERKASCIYSQLKNCSSSEVAAMMEGVIRHITEMEVEKQYVDTHGQSYVAFAFCYLLGFKLLPRLKGIHSKKLYRPFSGQSGLNSNLHPVLSRLINWELIRQQYDQMIKFTTAIKMGTADTESILRRFTRDNLKHPTYQALLELGKAVRTIFLCNYLHSKDLRTEIQEGLNVIELWNEVNDFIFFAKGGEFATNRKGNQELGMLSLQLLQNCLVYINTLMIQQTLSDPGMMKIMKPEDLRGLTPLIFYHINPYGSFNLDMKSRLPIDTGYREAA